MKTLALIITANQNEVSKKEIEKIRKVIKKEFPDYRLKVIANYDREESEKLASKCDQQIVFNTKDINYKIWAEYVDFVSTLMVENETIALN
jgi:hypothetical protein